MNQTFIVLISHKNTGRTIFKLLTHTILYVEIHGAEYRKKQQFLKMKVVRILNPFIDVGKIEKCFIDVAFIHIKSGSPCPLLRFYVKSKIGLLSVGKVGTVNAHRCSELHRS